LPYSGTVDAPAHGVIIDIVSAVGLLTLYFAYDWWVTTRHPSSVAPDVVPRLVRTRHGAQGSAARWAHAPTWRHERSVGVRPVIGDTFRLASSVPSTVQRFTPAAPPKGRRRVARRRWHRSCET
jgi:hypothetical protein